MESINTEEVIDAGEHTNPEKRDDFLRTILLSITFNLGFREHKHFKLAG